LLPFLRVEIHAVGAEGGLDLANTNIARLDPVICGEAGYHTGRVTGGHAVVHALAGGGSGMRGR